VKINWCFKGIKENASFGDADALRALRRLGITSRYLKLSRFQRIFHGADGHGALGPAALYRHVHDYPAFGGRTPYISLSAGVRQFVGSRARPFTFGALATAMDFATDFGTASGYVFSCWVVTSLKPVPEIPGLAEDLRDLNLFEEFSTYNHEGEIAAKLVVPSRQIDWVAKIDPNGHQTPAWGGAGIERNRDFTPPDRLSNVFEAID